MSGFGRIFCLVAIGIAVSTSGAAMAQPLNVVASFSVLADVVGQVGGDRVHVTSLIGPNESPHVFEPAPKDAQVLQDSDVVFVSGLGLEGWMDRLIAASGYRGHPVVASDGITVALREKQGREVSDPHVWNSPVNVLVWVRNVESALAAADPKDADVFARNAARYAVALHSMDADAHAKIDAIAPAQRKILTSHDAFGYLGREFGITFLAPQGFSTDAEPSARGVGKIIDQIKAEGIKTYFLENSTDPRLVQQIAAETGAQPGGVLYPESLSAADGPAPTYVTMFRYNMHLLVKAMAN